MELTTSSVGSDICDGHQSDRIDTDEDAVTAAVISSGLAGYLIQYPESRHHVADERPRSYTSSRRSIFWYVFLLKLNTIIAIVKFFINFTTDT